MDRPDARRDFVALFSAIDAALGALDHQLVHPRSNGHTTHNEQASRAYGLQSAPLRGMIVVRSVRDGFKTQSF